MYTPESEIARKNYHRSLGYSIDHGESVQLKPSVERYKPWIDDFQKARRDGTIGENESFRQYSASRMIKLEQQYLHRHSTPSYTWLEINENLASFKAMDTASLLQGHPDDYHVLDSIKDIISNMTYHTESGTIGGLTVQERLRLHLGRVFPTSREEDFVFFEKYDDAIPLLIKTADRSQGEIEENRLLPHQYFVGMIINRLKEVIPNFMYTYGMAYTPLPIANPPLLSHYYYEVFINNVTHSTQTMLFLESINGTNIRDHLDGFAALCDEKVQRVKIEEVKGFIMQVLYSLEIAQSRYRFVHNDLHLENVLISRHYDEPHPIIYHRPNGKTRYLLTSTIAMIIDYGDSYLEVDGLGYGTFREEFGIFPRFNQLTDGYRFISNILHYLIHLPSGNYLTELIAPLDRGWRFFYQSTEPTAELIDLFEQEDTYFILQNPPANSSDAPVAGFANHPPVEYPATSSLFSMFIDIIERELEVTYQSREVLSPESLSTYEVLITEGFLNPSYPSDLTTGYYRLQVLADHIQQSTDLSMTTHLTDAYRDVLDYLKSLPSYSEQLDSLVNRIKRRSNNDSIFVRMKRYPPRDGEDPRAKSYTINYLRLLTDANLITTNLKYLMTYDLEKYEPLARQNEKLWTRLKTDQIMLNLMKELPLVVTTHTLDEWFSDNYHRLMDIIGPVFNL